MNPSPLTPARPRIGVLDALRGFALMGILLVNARDIVAPGTGLSGGSGFDGASRFLFAAVQDRFVPLFAVLFGTSFFLVLEGAKARSAHPSRPLLRRLIALTALGFGLVAWYANDILIEYGLFGLLLLPVLRFAPRGVILVLGLAATITAYAVAGGGTPAVPGLLLLGFAGAAYGVPQRLEEGSRWTPVVFVSAVALTVPALIWQWAEPDVGWGDPRYSHRGGTAGVIMTAAYVSGFALMWRTRARVALAWFFAPLGRMALSNFVGGAAIVLATTAFVDYAHMSTATPIIALAVGVIVVQSLASRLWLRSFRYGPLEWVWRVATWWRPTPLRRLA